MLLCDNKRTVYQPKNPSARRVRPRTPLPHPELRLRARRLPDGAAASVPSIPQQRAGPSTIPPDARRPTPDALARAMSTSSGVPESWISSFCALLGHEYFAEVSEEFIEDDFNLTGLQTQVAMYKEALEVRPPCPFFSPPSWPPSCSSWTR